ncbi:MAG: hypothetical protein QOJ81_2194 [Chloroflexota bacterium]|nr:hypothetical protein [Chloroflexota bacterium]
MTLALAPTTPTPRSTRPIRRGWRPRFPGEFPTLGWQVLDFLTAYLPNPRNEREPLRLTDEQARRILHIYELDPLTGRRLVRRVHEEEAKGWGKGPFSGILMIAEFKGPVLPDGWDADGQPVGRPWGTSNSPAPWIQVAAVSESQTGNAWNPMRSLLEARSGTIAETLRIDPGITRCYATDMPGAFMERVSTRAGSKEGQPITHAVIDEGQLLDPSNNGDELVRTILRNLTKNDGWAHFTNNAPIEGTETVAEEWWGEDGPGVYRFATRPSKRPDESWTDDEKLAAIREVYRDVPWMLDHVARILADVNEPKVPWGEKLRYTFNVRTKASDEANAWMPADVWEAAAGDVVMRADLPTYVVVSIAHDHRSAAVAIAQLQPGGIALRARTFSAPEATGEYVRVDEIEDHLRGLHKRYPAHVVMVKRYHPKGRDHLVPQHGPEFVYHGSFFEGSKQKLERDDLVFIDIPNSQERLAPAAETLLNAAINGELVHDGGSDLTAQIGAVEADEATKGWTVEAAGPAARAAMLAAHRARIAPRPASRRMHFGGRPS